MHNGTCLTYRVVNNVGLVDVDIGEVVKTIHSTRRKVLVDLRRLGREALDSANEVKTSVIIDLVPEYTSVSKSFPIHSSRNDRQTYHDLRIAMFLSVHVDSALPFNDLIVFCLYCSSSLANSGVGGIPALLSSDGLSVDGLWSFGQPHFFSKVAG